ncbi:hypothetical protein [Vibrio ezurae]|uniref:Uncharacterized protein n=1 Tax=Vibrio ezurae NBRC 102218 TaxID=1219080 RepID=U3CTR5_9VIBR|nr:hypothetical protein [Vibrio ezurae]GAD81053.1 hypothetical protein VEZ01S_49_00110 [Vibrio ezurae NBRC 102218]
MLRYIILFGLTIFSCFVLAKDVYVNGYTRSDGTQVKGHYRTAPDATVNNNYSTEGNINPHTGKKGWIKRDSGHNEASSINGVVTRNYPNGAIVSNDQRHNKDNEVGPIIYIYLFALCVALLVIIAFTIVLYEKSKSFLGPYTLKVAFYTTTFGYIIYLLIHN